ncbi:MAG: energy transducer TonB [Bacteroidia bacterium]|nr:energy transducer TonB [Bacteroidia bacterium]
MKNYFKILLANAILLAGAFSAFSAGGAPLPFSGNPDTLKGVLSGATIPKPKNLAQVKSLIQYPESARDNGIQGELPVRVLIDKKGRIVSHEYMTENARFFREAVDPHIYKLRFESATYQGQAMNAWVTIWFEFKLTD